MVGQPDRTGRRMRRTVDTTDSGGNPDDRLCACDLYCGTTTPQAVAVAPTVLRVGGACPTYTRPDGPARHRAAAVARGARRRGRRRRGRRRAAGPADRATPRRRAMSRTAGTPPARRRDLLLPALRAVQDRVGYISEPALAYICRRLSVPPAIAYGVASSTRSSRRSRAPPAVAHVCDDIACRLQGAEQIATDLERTLGPDGAARAGRRDDLAPSRRASASASGRRRPSSRSPAGRRS